MNLATLNKLIKLHEADRDRHRGLLAQIDRQIADKKNKIAMFDDGSGTPAEVGSSLDAGYPLLGYCAEGSRKMKIDLRREIETLEAGKRPLEEKITHHQREIKRLEKLHERVVQRATAELKSREAKETEEVSMVRFNYR